MSRSVLPTTDLYFLNSCDQWIGRWWRRRPIERLGANCFRCGNRLLLIRHDDPRLMERALHWTGTLVYLIDDDIEGAAQSPGLPAAYRERLRRFATDHHDRLLRRADLLITSSDILRNRFEQAETVRARILRLDPVWSLPLADLRHFGHRGEASLDIVHLGTASHAGGLARTTPALLAVLDRFAQTRFTYFGRPGSHPALEAHPRVRRLDPMDWSRYRRWLPRQRFNLALYPLEPTAFDRARSSNKIIEHAIAGAVGVYPRDWRPAAALGQGAILAPGDPADWAESLTAAVAQRDLLASRAAHAATVVRALNDPGAQRRFWARTLGIEPPR